MKTNYEKYRDEKLRNPEFQVKYAFAKEKLNLKIRIDPMKESLLKEEELQIKKNRLKIECEKLDSAFERSLAEEGMALEKEQFEGLNEIVGE